MIEAELKAEITNLDIRFIESKLLEFDKKPNQEVYSDVYFSKDPIFDSNEQELRLRTITSNKKIEKKILAYKSIPLDHESKSKEETELEISDVEKMQEILLNLGFHVKIKFQKICTNYTTFQYGKEFLITLVSFTEMEAKFIEIETLISNSSQLNQSLTQIKKIITSLQIPLNLITNHYYTDLFLSKK